MMCEICEIEEPNLRKIWAAADKKAKDWREAGEEKLLRQMLDAREGLKSLGWRDGQYAPKDGTRFLSIEVGSTGVFPCYWMDNDLMTEGGGFWSEAHGDLWPAKPTLWKPMPSNAKAVGLDAAGGQSHTSDGLCVAVTKEISMPSKVFMICNSYESGYGRGLANDGLDLSKTPHADPEQGEAYQIGYEEGCAAARRGKHLPATIHSAKECSEAFEWLRAEATRDGAPPQAGIALDEWHALTMAATHNAELYVAVEET